MNPPGPPHHPPHQHSPIPTPPQPPREKRRGIAGAVITIIGSALAILLASGEWRFSSGGLPISGSSKTLWELGDDEGFIPYTAFGWTAVLCALGAGAYLLLPLRRQRRAFAIALLVMNALQALLGWVTVPVMRDAGYGSGGAGIILAVVPTVALAGAVLVLRGTPDRGHGPGMAPPPTAGVGPLPSHPPMQPTAQPPIQPPQALTAQLEEIADLKARGLINDEEFAAQRRRILGTG